MNRWMLFLLACFATPAAAHQLGESYLFLNVMDDRFTGRIEAQMEDLDQVFALDTDQDGKTSPAELAPRQEELAAYLQRSVTLKAAGAPMTLAFADPTVMPTRLGDYFVLSFSGPPIPVGQLVDVEYNVLVGELSQHRGLLVVEQIEHLGLDNTQEEVLSALFDGDRRTHQLDTSKPPEPVTFSTFVWEGVWHIWIGIDHVLFLIGLLLPSVFKTLRSEESVTQFSTALWHVVKIVTIFTVAHSITLSLAALDVISLPSWVVESIIAASIVVVALNNIWPILGNQLALVTFIFGLFHGMGFASVLSDLTLATTATIATLVGFNIGVELGQIVIVAAVLPILFVARNWSGYRPYVLTIGSYALALFGTIWLIERVFDLSIISS